MPEPVVSVHMLTFNHAPFIREAIDSVLAQQTDFVFEIVSHRFLAQRNGNESRCPSIGIITRGRRTLTADASRNAGIVTHVEGGSRQQPFHRSSAGVHSGDIPAAEGVAAHA